MVVQPDERNSLDQRWLEYALWEAHGVRLLRRSLLAINTTAEFRDDHALIVDGHQVKYALYFDRDYLMVYSQISTLKCIFFFF